MNREYKLRLRSPGPRPAYFLVADHLWGESCNIDSDGNSRNPEDTNWTELSLFLRDAPSSEQVHVDPLSEEPLVLEIRSPSQVLCERVAGFLLAKSGGSIERAV